MQHPVRAPVPSVVEPVALAPLDALRGDVSHSTAKVAFERMRFGLSPFAIATSLQSTDTSDEAYLYMMLAVPNSAKEMYDHTRLSCTT